MSMQLRHALPTRLVVVDRYVIAVGLMMCIQKAFGVRQRLEQRGLLGLACFELGGEVAARDDDGVAQRNRETVLVGHGQFIFGEDAPGVGHAEGTGFGSM